jgi:hypothetical protein
MLAYPQAMRPRVGGLLASVRVVTTRCSRCLIKPPRILAAGSQEYRTKSSDPPNRHAYRETLVSRDIFEGRKCRTVVFGKVPRAGNSPPPPHTRNATLGRRRSCVVAPVLLGDKRLCA